MARSTDRLSLPWTEEKSESLLFRAILAGLLLVLLVLSLAIPYIDLPEPERSELEKLPPQLAKLIEKQEPLKVPEPEPVPESEPEPEPEPEPELKPEPVPEPKPEPKPQPVPKKKPPEPIPDQAAIKEARDVAKKSGLLALQDDLADLRSAVDVSNLTKKSEIRAEKTLAAKANAVPGNVAASKSRGIETDTLARPAEQVALEDHDAARLAQTEAERQLAIAEAEAAQRSNERSEESIRYTNEKLKAPLYALYNRELRKDPFLEGRMLLEVVIEASGEVSYCRVMESGLNHKTLETKVCNRVLLANYGAENVARKTITIPFTFQPK